MKRIFLLLFLEIVPYSVFSQQDKSDLSAKFYKLVDSVGYLYNKRNYKEALRTCSEAVQIGEKALGKDHPDYASSLNALALCNSSTGNYQEAVRLETEALDIRKRVLGTDHHDYLISLNNLALFNSYIGNYQEAMKFGTEALDFVAKVSGTNHPDYATMLDNIATFNSGLANYQEAVRFGTEALEIRRKSLGTNHPDYATSLSNLAGYNSSLGNYQEAVRLGTEALGIRKKVLGTNHPDYAISLNNLAMYNLGLGNYREAVRFGSEAVEITGKVLGKEHPTYATSLSNLALYNSYTGNYQESIRLETEALKIREKILGRNHPDYATSLNYMSKYNSDVGNYQKAVSLGAEALEIIGKAFGKEHPYYATLLANLAEYNTAMGNYQESIRLTAKALGIYEKTLGREHPYYATSLSDLAIYYSELGNYREAVRLGTEALEIKRKLLGTSHPDYAISLSNLAEYNSVMGNYGEAVRLVTEALEIMSKTLGKDHPNYALSLSNLARYNSYSENYQEAVRLETEALEIRARSLGKDHPYYATSLGNLAMYKSEMGSYHEAVRLETEALGIMSKTLGRDHPGYATMLVNLAVYSLRNGDNVSGSKYLDESVKTSSKIVLNTFSTMTARERDMFWKKYHAVYKDALPIFSYATQNPLMYRDTYDGLLMGKGLLLNAETEMRDLLLESGDSAVSAMYVKLQSDRAMTDKQYQLPPERRTLNTDSLSSVIETEEKELVGKSKVLGDYTRNLSVRWEDVQKRLGAEDLALEFTDFPFGSDSTMYAAMVLKKGMPNPVMVPLFEKRELDGIKPETYYTQPSLSDLIWHPLSEYMKGVRNVYFSPSGVLYQIAVESLPLKDGKSVSEEYSMYRLSSTRELVTVKEKVGKVSAALYGGLIYNLLASDWKSRAGESEARASGYRDMPSVDAESVRLGLQYLKGSEDEVKVISKELTAKNIRVSVLTGKEGTEESFKRLSGKRTGILHIATHGYYQTSDTARGRSGSPLLAGLIGDGSRGEAEDRSLSRSGLFMSGAGDALDSERRKEIPGGAGDGILKAKEISRTDLRGLDLVVLSACRTGLGDVTSEGVFGLQRGFKKAGAQTIMMSLWKVNDVTTGIMMESFYRNLTEGQSKRTAFLNAQNYLRRYDGGRYGDPKYWAAFILLDALD